MNLKGNFNFSKKRYFVFEEKQTHGISREEYPSEGKKPAGHTADLCEGSDLRALSGPGLSLSPMGVCPQKTHLWSSTLATRGTCWKGDAFPFPELSPGPACALGAQL